MFEMLFSYFVQRPDKLKTIALSFVNTGGLLLLLGAIGRVAKIGVGALTLVAGKPAELPMLANIYPSLPTCLVPEGVFGFVFAIAVMAIGVWLAVIAKQMQKFFEM